MDPTLISTVSRSVEDAVFDTALSLEDDGEREAFLRMVFAGDPEGLSRVRRMLEHSGESSAFFLDVSDHSSVLAGEILGVAPEETPVPSGGEEPGSRIGPYVTIARIGEGGCGVVYEAEQQQPVRRRVALKILRRGMDTESVIARFEAERQALASMDHPNIARVYDAGTTATGRPYFAMERVCGERITECCDREGLGIVGRIHLFIRVCHAIQHAHQKGVIHRDIKPSNILVTFQDGIPVPKVIDFGIAKAASPGGASERIPWTMRNRIVGTPAYMSPEQVDLSGIDVDTRSDIYSLGALLHELLGGQPPFDEAKLARSGISAMRRTLLEEEPPLLSRMVAGLPEDERAKIAAKRNEQPGRLIARLRGDLDWIVAKAIAKDRNRRYQTVSAFAADLHRFLADEPVTARRPSRWYLLGKFVRRNRTACGLGAAVALSLLAGLGASTTLYIREHEALAEQERLAERLEKAREQAQARANVSQVAVLLSEKKIEEADALLRQSPLEAIEPSREAAGVFRTLGSRNVIQGRWQQAVQCFALLDQANRLDDPVKIVEEGDLLMIAPVLLRGSGPVAYDAFRRDILARYLPATNSLQAEHLLKVALLAPADAELFDLLAPAAEMCAEGFRTKVEPFPAWEAFSMMLYRFRQGDMPGTLEWADRTLSYPDPEGPRIASTLSLRAMAESRSGEKALALEDAAEARRMIDAGTRFGPAWEASIRGTWFSWVIASILLEEAERELSIDGGSSVPQPDGH